MASDKELPTGGQKPSTTWGEFNNISFLVSQAIGKLQTATLVQIKACTNAGGLSPVGFVDIVPMVNQMDAAGNPTPHVTIFNVPYLRIQGGRNAMIMDPEPGDIGIAVFASRDIGKVKATKAPANPGSFRQYDFADAMYLGGMLNAAPEQYVQFNSAGITIHSPNQVKLDAPLVTVVADKFQIHASQAWSWDVAGFGEQWSYTGGVAWEHRTWQTGATVTNVSGPISQPDGTPT